MASSQGKWTCTVCHREMDALSKASHLQGKPHIAKAHAQSPIRPVDDSLTHDSGADPLPGVWTCTTCNCQMPISCRETHLQGKPHLKKVAVPPSSSRNTGELRSTLEYWRCTICDCHLPLGSRETHLRGKTHLKKAARSVTNLTLSSVPTLASTSARTLPVTNDVQRTPFAGPLVTSPSRAVWTCEVCDRQMNPKNREQHLRGKQHRAIIAQSDIASGTRSTTTEGFWFCEVCSVSMNIAHREQHLEGEIHASELARRHSRNDGYAEESGQHVRGASRDTDSGRSGRGRGTGRRGEPGRGRGSRRSGGGGGGGGGGRRGRNQHHYQSSDWLLTGEEAESMIRYLRELGHGMIPGGGGCSDGDYSPYDSGPDWFDFI